MVQMPTAEEFAALQQALAEATRRSESLVGELRVVTTERDLALERLRALQRQLFAAKSEARGTDQQDLFLNEAEALAPTAQTLPAEIDDEDSTPVAGHQRKKRGRKPLDPALPRDIVRHELPESERVCAHDGHALVEIGAEVSEQMHVIPEQVRVLQHHRIKYACPCCDLSLKVAPTPARIIPRGLLTEEAQAWVITGKYQFGMPLYRTAILLRRFGGDIVSNTLAAGVVRIGQAVQPGGKRHQAVCRWSSLMALRRHRWRCERKRESLLAHRDCKGPQRRAVSLPRRPVQEAATGANGRRLRSPPAVAT
jgi:transposase